MYYLVLLPFAFILGLVPAIANSADSPLAAYVMQVSSNLSCESLTIELISQTDDSRQNISYTSNAFAAVELNSGTYRFGDVTCTNEGDAQTFDLLSDKVAPFELAAGQAYYGGRIIFQEVVTSDVNIAKKMLNECTRIISTARGTSDSGCLDGAGASPITTKQINVYLPEVTKEDIATVRSALSATEEQLLYLPLKV